MAETTADDRTLGLEGVIAAALWDHPSPIRKPVDGVMVWRCTGSGCDWRHDRAHDGGAAHYTHQAAHVAERVRAHLAPLGALHVKVSMHPHEEDCLLPDEHRDEWDFDGEFCPICPPDWFVCGTCHDDSGDLVEWPCETSAVLAATLGEGK